MSTIFQQARDLLRQVGPYANPVTGTAKTVNQLAQKLFSSIPGGLEGGIQRVQQLPVRQLFLPTAITTPQVKQQMAQAGRVLQQFPDTTLRLPQLPQPKLVGINLNPSPINATEFLTRIPGDTIRSYGQTAEKYGTGQKMGLTDYLNVSDFVPGLGFVGAGVKPLVKEVVEDTAVKQFVKEGSQKTAVKGLLTESPAQTEFRRKAGLGIKDVYTKVQDLLGHFTKPDGVFKNIPPEKKVGIVDYLRTPEPVLKKLGLEREAKLLLNAQENYKLELPRELNKINDWYKQVPSPYSAEHIFDYLDGSLSAKFLTPDELRVGNEIKTYLSKWADRLGIPQEKRITNYITHIFEKGDIELEFDQGIAKMIENKVPKSVYDPFLQKRKGKDEYIRDVWRALDAYTKRAVRKANFDPALQAVERASKDLDTESTKYIQRLTAGINMRPTEIDNLLDNFIKSTPAGYKFGQRPTAAITQKLRRWTYRGALGLNVGSALRNITQTSNTYAKLGERWTATGLLTFARKAASRDLDELTKVGVLQDSFIQDRKMTALKSTTEQMDKGLFYLFEWAEKFNRGVAYYGAKSKFLNEGLPEAQAIQKAKEIVRQTQFTFGAVDTPVILQSDIAKLFAQFQSYNIKQAEFLTGMVKNKEWAGLFRYGLSSLVLAQILSKSIGYDLKDAIPFSGVASGETKLGQTPSVQLGKGIVKATVKAPDEYGNIPEGNMFSRIFESKDVRGAIPAFIPAGVQAKKTIQGVQSFAEGASYTPTGRKRFDVEQTPSNALMTTLFGQYSVPEGRQYVENLGTSEAERIHKELKSLPPQEAALRVKQLKAQDPQSYQSLMAYIADTKLEISKREKTVRNLPVKDGSRTRSIVKALNSKRTPQEKAELYKRYKQLGIITEDIQRQLNAAKKAGVLK